MKNERITQGEALALIRCLFGLPDEVEITQFAVSVHLHETPGQCEGVTKVFSNSDANQTVATLMSGMLTIAMRGGRTDDETDPEAGFGFGSPFPWQG